MLTINPHYITDDAGKKISVVIPIKDFKSIIEELEELEDIRLYTEAKQSDETSIPIDKVFKMIKEKRESK